MSHQNHIFRISMLCLSVATCIQAGVNRSAVNRFAFDERPDAYKMRQDCGYNQTYRAQNYDIELENNGDQESVPNIAGNFTKTLDHDATTGVASGVGQANYFKLVQAINNGQQASYNTVERYNNPNTRQLADPQASSAWTLIGRDSALIPFALPPKLDSRAAGAEMAEVYLQALCRSVHFNDYGTGLNTDRDTFNGGSITNNAAAILNAYGDDFHGPKIGGQVTATTLFRGVGQGCLDGPYISQFMWQDLHLLQQPLLATQQFVPVASNREFGVTWDNFVAIQNGLVPVPYDDSDFNGTRYIIDGRDAGTWVHNDVPIESYTRALNILINNGFPFGQNLPYYNGDMPNEAAFATMGVADVASVVASVTDYALKHAWAHKWRAARRLRPEAMGGLVHRAQATGDNPYGLNDDIFGTLGGVDLLAWVKWYNNRQTPTSSANKTYLLALMYPEGSPTHPSYPAGHAVVAGAATTVLKAFFDDEALFRDYLTPRKPSPTDPTTLVALSGEGENSLTVGGELNKLASNIALARDFAGVHYRSDGDEGINLGETAAIYYLQDWAHQYTEQDFNGFELTKRDGVRIRITANDIITIS